MENKLQPSQPGALQAQTPNTTFNLPGNMSAEYENMQVEKWVNLEDVAEHLSLSQDTVRTWIKEGKLPVYKAGKRYKFKISEVDEWVREGKIKE